MTTVYVVVAYVKDSDGLDRMAGNLAVYSTMNAARRQCDVLGETSDLGTLDIEMHEIDEDPEMDR